LSAKSETIMALPTGTETILIVEDEDPIRTLTVRMLKPLGYTLIEARDGIEALNLCQDPDAKIDLVLCDMMMPKMSGKDFAKKLFDMPNPPKLLFVSGYSSDETLQGKTIGRDIPYIAKPYTREQLALKVRAVLDSH
jgi:two-component system cell cycle sensor histidine kinase/response regulator CckA